jgi:hypothetical protein
MPPCCFHTGLCAEGKPLNLVVFNGVGSLAVLLIQLAIIGRWPGN